MVNSLLAPLVVASISGALAYPSVARSRNGTCEGYTIAVSPSSTGLHYSYPPFKDNFDVVEFVTRLSSRDSASFYPFSGPLSLSGNYTIAAEICSPAVKTGKEKTLLLTSHGLGYHGDYWNPPVEPPIEQQYNFVGYALGQGYSVFNYDRLGTGRSSRVDGYNEGQTSQQIAILTELAQLLRNGQYTGSIGAPSKLVLVGHSFGSFISNGVVAGSTANNSLIDGLLLTGFSYNLTSPDYEAFALKIASTERREWADLDNGYITWNDVYSNVAVFFRAPAYSHAVANWTECQKQAIALSEFLTFPMLDLYSPGFTGPVQILNGELDFGICDGNCTDWVEPYAAKMFPNAKVVEVLEHPSVGHAINFQYNSTGAYSAMMRFVDKHLA
ncbi:hypothetical protein EV356DRAFT_451250 [Viridothelium virens]|uniref:AB hydrolase-1 domain-containing protein n=1 Tax=Viridothelium virens TaxID=1048519 RepID=A0A6A6H1P4_VIRVR|nr:hypothetical protein EV356DRAFT_451250 [Viridothelium virens]